MVGVGMVILGMIGGYGVSPVLTSFESLILEATF